MTRQKWYVCVDEKVIQYSNGLDGSNFEKSVKFVVFEGTEKQCMKWYDKNNGIKLGYYLSLVNW